MVATASDTSGPPSMPSTQSRTSERRKRRDNGAEADQAGDAQHRQHRGVRASVHAIAQSRKAPIVDRHQNNDRDKKRAPRPRRLRPRRGGRSPFRLAQKRRVHARQDEQRHQEIDRDDDNERRAASAIGGPSSLGRPWSASGGSNVLAVVARSRTTRSSAAFSCDVRAIALAPGARTSLRPPEPPHAEAEHDERGDEPKPWRGEGRGAEERHRDRVLNRGRSGRADMVKVVVPSAIAAGMRRLGIAAARNN